MDLKFYAKNNPNFTWRKPPKRVESHVEGAPNLMKIKWWKVRKYHAKISRERFSQLTTKRFSRLQNDSMATCFLLKNHCVPHWSLKTFEERRPYRVRPVVLFLLQEWWAVSTLNSGRSHQIYRTLCPQTTPDKRIIYVLCAPNLRLAESRLRYWIKNQPGWIFETVLQNFATIS